MARTWSDIPNGNQFRMVAGVDWGGGSHSATVVTIGYIRADKHFVVVRFEQLPVQEKPDAVLDAVAKLCKEFRVQIVAADGGGNGIVYNPLLLAQLGSHIPLFAIIYSSINQEPRQEGPLHKWIVDRSGSIGNIFSRIKKQMTHFPRVADCGNYLDQFTCEVADYDENQRTVKYLCPESHNDDALHALNYAQLVGLRLWHMQHYTE